MENSERYKQLVILHSNDMHGDFLAENVDEKLVGGVSMLSGYISKVKEEEPNVLYCVAGDMFRGSVIDSEYQGVSTIEIMNMLSPDIVTIGNHETDYGLAHLLFIEKCAKFPIINANLHIKMNGARLFQPYKIVEIDGMKILFIGILTEEVMSKTKTEGVVGSLVDIEDAAQAIGKICNTFNGIDIDFTVLLTHIGFEEDIILASNLDPSWGVDVIVGGHSHTFIEKPEIVNDVLIVQAGTGTDQIGRFDLLIDTETNSVASYKWQAVPINEKTCPRDDKMEKLVADLKSKTDLKYGRVLRRLKKGLNHENRYKQTELGSFIADIFKRSLKVDMAFAASGAIRVERLDPIITLQDIMAAYPYSDVVYQLTVTGKQLRTMLTNVYRKGIGATDGHEFYQLSEGMKVEYDTNKKEITLFEFDGDPIKDDYVFTYAIRHFDYVNFDEFFGVPIEEVKKNANVRTIATSSTDVIYEFLESDEPSPDYPVSDRLRII